MEKSLDVFARARWTKAIESSSGMRTLLRSFCPRILLNVYIQQELVEPTLLLALSVLEGFDLSSQGF
jgi:hypothetical protein